MTIRSFVLTALVMILVIPSAAGADVQSLEDELRATETAFAATMADRDLEAFAAFLDAETVFSSGQGPLRGKKAVLEVWSRYFEGDSAPFSWRPEEIMVHASGTMGLSSGPVFDPQGKRVGTFNSVWRKDAEKGWLIIFDRGCPACSCP